MSNFDIGTLLNFNPPKYLCEKCKALLYDAPGSFRKQEARCPVCNIEYISFESGFMFHQVGEYLRKEGYSIRFSDQVTHGQRLAAIAYNFKKGDKSYPPMRALFEAINVAQSFIHFVSYGLSHIILGALKLKSQSIPVRGVVAKIHPEFHKNEIKGCTHEAPKLELAVFEKTSSSQDTSNIPHQKMVVIDGLLAFKGAANLTNDGWRKAESGYDYIEVVTNIEEITEFHNKLFSPIWAKSNQCGNKIYMDDFPF